MQKLTLLLLMIVAMLAVKANQTLGADIRYQKMSNTTLTYRTYVTRYTNSALSNDSILISWGDGLHNYIPLQASEIAGIGLYANIYEGIHTYSGTLTDSVISISWTGNRRDGISNINSGNSANVPLYVEAQVVLGKNNSTPTKTSLIPVYGWQKGTLFLYSLWLYDNDGDSLAVHPVVPLQGEGAFVPFYLYPDQYAPDTSNNYDVDTFTGTIVWDKPPVIGVFAVAFKIEEYRNGQFIGSSSSDFLIIIEDAVSVPTLLRDAIISLSPNPATTQLTLTLNNVTPNATLQIFTIQGQQITAPQNVTQQYTQIDVSNLPAGLYFAVLQNSPLSLGEGAGVRSVRRFVKE